MDGENAEILFIARSSGNKTGFASQKWYINDG